MDRRHLTLIYHYLLGYSGKIIGVEGVGSDVTDSKWKEDEFSRFTAMANAPVIGVNRLLRIELWNAYTEKITGFSASEAIGEHLVEKFID